ncbi:hypothetical protein Mgra_00005235 [Meloidogyne graminicola]|uniref:Uncharacterized protein n=1 Tax=Meloidogyne graminicola TaxID=189291 RepID=A0A8S9ZQT3_9BILA|nr:hypothetical protein Mgra_00005235 [Meloidogyne graminicola]
MSKRKIEDERNIKTLWEKFKLDSKGFLHDIQIKQSEANEEGTEKGNKKLFEIYQGNREEKLAVFPTPSGEPSPGINGFRSLTLEGIRDWENGIENITDFISKISTLLPKGISAEEEREHKLCLQIYLPFAFKGILNLKPSRINIVRKSPILKRISPHFYLSLIFTKSFGSFSYSEGGHLAEFLTRFPLLAPNPHLFYRYDINVYCENDVLVENYFSDLDHWLSIKWNKISTQENIVRQSRLKFVVDREDTAQQIIALLKEKFETSVNPCTFALRFDCPGFTLKPFNVENTNTGEFMAMEFKNEYTLKSDQDIDDFEEEIEIEPLIKKKPPTDDKNGNSEKITQEGEEDNNNSNSSSSSILIWNSYKLVRATDANILSHLIKGNLPLLKRKLILN